MPVYIIINSHGWKLYAKIKFLYIATPFPSFCDREQLTRKWKDVSSDCKFFARITASKRAQDDQVLLRKTREMNAVLKATLGLSEVYSPLRDQVPCLKLALQIQCTIIWLHARIQISKAAWTHPWLFTCYWHKSKKGLKVFEGPCFRKK